MEGLYVQFGCGWCAPRGWLNFDASPTLRFERIPIVGHLYTKNASRFPENVRYGDIVKGLPVDADSCLGVYSSHTLEHLTFCDAERALANTYAYLKQGGTFRLVVPDLERLARDYLADASATAAHRFMESACLGLEDRPRGLAGLLKHWLGNATHLWMYDEKALTEMLSRHGFTSIRRCSFGDASDPRFHEVEEADRFDGCLALECRKAPSMGEFTIRSRALV
jgi:hypothetical protein